MSLLQLSDIKLYLRVETNAEDVLLQKLLDDAFALIESYLQRPILSTSPVYAGIRADRYPAARAVRTNNGDATYGASTSNTVPLDALPDYAMRIERVINSALYDMVADKYFNRNPSRTSESGSGMSVAYAPNGIPMRVITTLNSYRAR